MNIEIDYNPSPENSFFISVWISDNEVVSFDYTSKGHRIIKQVLIAKKPFPNNKEPTAEWDAIVITNRKFVRKYHAKWIDMDTKDWINDEIWETVWSKPISQEDKDALLHCSQLFSDNYFGLEKFSKELEEFEKFLSKEIAQYIYDKKI